ncbi:MAG: hypothetical protein EX271_07205, partial [Acidimicrobiales bacterium]
MGSFGKWLTGIVILAIAALLFQLLTPWGARAHSVKMGESVKEALNTAGFSSIDVDMSGNVARLSGTTPSEDVKNTVVTTAENTFCEKCTDRKNDNIWHEVDARDLTVKKLVPTVSPYTLSGMR